MGRSLRVKFPCALYHITSQGYVHLNPVRVGIVKESQLYRWSSYSGYIGEVKEERWVEYSWVLSQFGHDTDKARKLYKKYTEKAINEEVKSSWAGVYAQVVLGRKEFIERLRGDQ